MGFRSIIAALITAAIAAPVSAQQPGKLSGYMFGDFYWMAQNHQADREDANGFWFRRIYFTYDQPLDEAFTARFRLELNSPGDFRTKGRITPFLKDAYLRWNHGRHNVVFGLSPTPTFEVIENIWGYRSVEKTPLDLQRFAGSRDFGVALQGAFDAGSRVKYHLMVANGADVESETNKNKAVYLSLGYQASTRLFLEAYGDWQSQPAHASRYTWQGFAVYQTARGRLGAQFTQQARRQGAGIDLARLEIASMFAVGKLSDRVSLLGRVDRMFDPNPEGEKIPYLPFSADARSLLTLFGVDLAPSKNVHVIPNVEIVRYDRIQDSRPGADVVPRITLYYVWN